MEKEHQNAEDAGKWINLVKQYEYPTEPTAELLNTLIEKILIHEPVKSSPGLKDQEIGIFTILSVSWTKITFLSLSKGCRG